MILYLKALHIIFVVTWFAGLFYIVRLFIYQTEANDMEEPKKSILIEQFKIMQSRLWYGITYPSMILTIVFGGSLLYQMPGYLKMGFMHLKLAFVVFLIIYHFMCGAIFNQLKNNQVKYSSNQLRIWNEVATLFLVAIVFLIVLKSSLDMVWGIVGLIVFSLMLMLAIRIYKRVREGKS